MLKQDQFILPGGVTVRDSQGNQYVIERVLGRGEFGAVYLVRERQGRHNLFALKEVINPNKADRERFAFEAKVLKRLQHRALPCVHHVFENDKLKRVYLLMDYIRGRNLEDLRGEQPDRCFPSPLVLALMAPIVDALMYLHRQDPPIVHRDIKPANIIVPVGGGGAMLADFGSAKEYVPGTATTMVSHHSPGYAALEQYRTGTNPSTDIFGLGATLYALLTGMAPIDAPSRVVGGLSSGVDPLQPAHLLKPELPLAVSRALQRAMAIKMADRFQSVEEFWLALQAHDAQQLSRAPSSDASQSSAPERVMEDRDTESLQKAPGALRATKTRALAVLISVFMVLALTGAPLAYLKGFTLLFLCCLGVLLLALAALFFARLASARIAEELRVGL